MEITNEQNRQDAKNISNSNVNITNGDITYNSGLSYTDVREICKDVCAYEIQKNSQMALETSKKRLQEFSEECIDRIDSEAKEHIEQFKNPDIQYSLRNAAIPYLRTGDKELKEDLINMFIDRLKDNQRTTTRSVIDEAIDIIPSLSQSSVALLSTITYSNLTRYFYPALEEDFNKLPNIFIHLQNITNLEIEHLVQQRCAIGGFNGISFHSSLESIFQKNYDLFFRCKMTMEDINISFHTLPAQLNGMTYFWRDIENPSFIRHTYTGSEYLKKQMQQYGQQTYIELYEKYLKEKPCMSDDEIKNTLITKNHNWEYAFKAMNMEETKAISLTPVGRYIGLSYLNRKININIPFNLFYPKL
jgi:hypothetical protein